MDICRYVNSGAQGRIGKSPSVSSWRKAKPARQTSVGYLQPKGGRQSPVHVYIWLKPTSKGQGLCLQIVIYSWSEKGISNVNRRIRCGNDWECAGRHFNELYQCICTRGQAFYGCLSGTSNEVSSYRPPAVQTHNSHTIHSMAGAAT